MTVPPSAPPLRVVVVDDEELARVRLRRLIAREDDVAVVGEADDAATAVEVIRRESPDLVLLDVQMPDDDGFSVIERLGADLAGQVVFVTAHDAYAVRAFEVSATDYLLKPVGADRLHEALERARAALAQRAVVRRYEEVLSLVRQPAVAGSGPRRTAAGTDERADGDTLHAPPRGWTERFLVRHGDRGLLVRAVDVDWLEAEANYVRLHVGGQRHLIRATMASLETTLDPSRFVRIHRAVIVNLDRVKEIQPWLSGDYVVLLHDGAKLRMSRSYSARLLARVRSG